MEMRSTGLGLTTLLPGKELSAHNSLSLLRRNRKTIVRQNTKARKRNRSSAKSRPSAAVLNVLDVKTAPPLHCLFPNCPCCASNTAGESQRDRRLLAFVSGLPASLPVDLGLHQPRTPFAASSATAVAAAKKGKIEKGPRRTSSPAVRHGKTIGASRSGLRIENRDWANWEGGKRCPSKTRRISPKPRQKKLVAPPRPGHAGPRPGSQKFNFSRRRLQSSNELPRAENGRSRGRRWPFCQAAAFAGFGAENRPANTVCKFGPRKSSIAKASWEEILAVNADLDSPACAVLIPPCKDKMKARSRCRASKAGDTVGGQIFEVQSLHQRPVGPRAAPRNGGTKSSTGRLAQAGK